MVGKTNQETVTRRQLARLEGALSSLESEPESPGVDPAMREVQRRGLRSQIRTLRQELDALAGAMPQTVPQEPAPLPTKLPFEEWVILLALAAPETLSIGEMSRRLSALTLADTLRIITKLEDLRLIRREPRATDHGAQRLLPSQEALNYLASQLAASWATPLGEQPASLDAKVLTDPAGKSAVDVRPPLRDE